MPEEAAELEWMGVVHRPFRTSCRTLPPTLTAPAEPTRISQEQPAVIGGTAVPDGIALALSSVATKPHAAFHDEIP